MLLFNFQLMCKAFVFCLKKQDIFLKKQCCVDFDFISLIHSYLFMHIALCYQEFYNVIIWPCHILYSEIIISYLSIDC